MVTQVEPKTAESPPPRPTCRGSCCAISPRIPRRRGGRPRARWSSSTSPASRSSRSGSRRWARRAPSSSRTRSRPASPTCSSRRVRERRRACIKFGGDALLLLFEGDDHVANACRVGGRGCGGRCARSAGSRCPARACSCGCRWACTPARSTSSSSAARTRAGRHRPGLAPGRSAMEHVAEAGEILVSPRGRGRAARRAASATRRAPGSCCKREPPGRHVAARDPDVTRRPEAVAHCLSTAVRDARAGRRRHARAPARSRSRSSTSTAPTS